MKVRAMIALTFLVLAATLHRAYAAPTGNADHDRITVVSRSPGHPRKAIGVRYRSVTVNCGTEISPALAEACIPYTGHRCIQTGGPSFLLLTTTFMPGRVEQTVICSKKAPHPLPSVAAILAEVTRRAPAPVTLAGGTDYLVHAAIVFYMTGPGGRSVRSVTIAHIPLSGYRLTARLALVRTVWTWGDGTSTTVGLGDVAGHPYSDATPCESATVCTAYIAHGYRRPGHATITVQAFWKVQVTVDGTGQNIPVAGDVYRTDPLGKTITVRRARVVLVPAR